jgi:hypothetical protein
VNILFSENFVTFWQFFTWKKEDWLVQKEEVLFPHLLIKALLLFFSLNQVLFEQNPTNLANWYPILLIFLATLKLLMKWGLQGQTRVQRQGDLKDNFIIPP